MKNKQFLNNGVHKKSNIKSRNNVLDNITNNKKSSIAVIIGLSVIILLLLGVAGLLLSKSSIFKKTSEEATAIEVEVTNDSPDIQQEEEHQQKIETPVNQITDEPSQNQEVQENSQVEDNLNNSEDSTTTDTTTEPEYLFYGIATIKLNVRSEATTKSDKIHTLAKGENIKIIGEVDGEDVNSNGNTSWYEIEYSKGKDVENTYTGFVYSKYIEQVPDNQ